LIQRHQAAAATGGLQLDLQRQDGQVLIRAGADARISAPVVVQLVRFRPLARVEIAHGENAGRTIDYANIVTSWRRIGLWDGRADLALKVEAAGDEAVVVILQDEGPGLVRAAALLR
jgi:hypothetical protein